MLRGLEIGRLDKTLSYSYLYMLSWTIHPFRLVITHDLLKDSPIDDVSIKNLLLFHHIRQIVFILMPSVCSVIDKSSPNMVRTPVAHLAELHVPLFCSHHILTPSVIWTDVYFLFTPILFLIFPLPMTKVNQATKTSQIFQFQRPLW